MTADERAEPRPATSGRTQERPGNACAEHDRAILLRPRKAAYHCRRGDRLNETGRAEDAKEAFVRALKLKPDDALAHTGLGNAEKYLGRFDAAYAAYAQAAALAPDTPGILLSLALIRRFAPNDERLPALERLAKNAGGLSLPETAHLHFALAKAYDDLGRYPEAFAAMKTANAAKRRLIVYDEPKTLAFLHRIAATFDAGFLSAHAGAGAPPDQPVFVVGMPRSGTTLVERIIAAHPEAYGAGEPDALCEILSKTAGGGEAPLDPASLTDMRLRRIGEAYLARIRPLAPGARRIVDKMTGNFRLAGFIRLALPNARIIHVRRDPRDTCLSCYSMLFRGRLDFTYDLAELGRYCRACAELMAHWRAVLPPETFLEIHYEDLVADFDTQARRLIAFCGLDWNDACARFHEAPGAVHTASAVQVRRPLYKNAIGRWKNYAEELAPLFAALEARSLPGGITA